MVYKNQIPSEKIFAGSPYFQIEPKYGIFQFNSQELDVIYNPKEPNAPELTHSVKKGSYKSETLINVFQKP